MQFVTYQSYNSIFEKSIIFYLKLCLPLKTAIEKFTVQKRFKLKTKGYTEERFGRMLLLITMIVWLHVYAFIAKISVIFQTARVRPGKSEIYKKALHEFCNQNKAHCFTSAEHFGFVVNLVLRAFLSTIFKMADRRDFENRRGEDPKDEIRFVVFHVVVIS